MAIVCASAAESLPVCASVARPLRASEPHNSVDGQPYGVFVDNNLGSRPEYLHRLCRGLRPVGKIWSAAVSIDVTDDPALIRSMGIAGCTGVFVGFESLTDENIADERKKTPKASIETANIRVNCTAKPLVVGSSVTTPTSGSAPPTLAGSQT